ncbi:MAG: hypothetical protein KatS3mg111_0469 [Pirellulaceae bacterium]|nr:MAG: hypothetical protein KatS3mg111_0469 [Pirellulaceae bacterium]
MSWARQLPVVALLAVYSHSIALGQPQGSDQQRLESPHRPILLNAAAVRTFDVLIRREVLHDIAPRNVRRAVSFKRVIVDLDKKRFLALTEGTSYTLKESTARETVRRAGMLHFDGRTYRADPIGQIRLVKSDLYGELSSIGIFDWRMIGVQQFPFAWYAPAHGFSFDAHLAKSLRPGTLAKVEEVPRKPDLLRIFRRTISDHPEVLGNDWDWRIDKTTLMPVEFTRSIRWKRDGVIKTAVERRETYQWQDRDGIYLPKSVTAEELASEDGIEYVVETNAQFHWFFVNEPISEERFSQRYLTDPTAFQDLIDPSRCGASDLITSEE